MVSPPGAVPHLVTPLLGYASRSSIYIVFSVDYLLWTVIVSVAAFDMQHKPA